MAFGLRGDEPAAVRAGRLLDAYTPQGAERLRASFRDPKPPYSWSGMDAFLGVICFNAEVAARDRLSRPNFWRDLLDPRLSGPGDDAHPSRSGTGLHARRRLAAEHGRGAAWAFMDALHAQVDAYPASGHRPLRRGRAGRKAAGLSFDMRGGGGEGRRRADRHRGSGRPHRLGPGGTGDLRRYRASGLARRVADWGVSREANQLYAQTYAVVAYPGVRTRPRIYPPHAEARMIRIDLAWMARHRPRIVAEWRRRYGDKAAP